MKKLIYLFVMIMLVSGCATVGSQSTPLQRKAMESKELEGTYEDAIKSTVSVLQDKGYQIINSDYQGGIISAETSKEVFNKFWGYKIAYKATINFEKFTENRSKMRLAIYRQIYNGIGGEVSSCPGSPKLRTGFVDDPQVYQDFYAEIQREIFRKNAVK